MATTTGTIVETRISRLPIRLVVAAEQVALVHSVVVASVRLVADNPAVVRSEAVGHDLVEAVEVAVVREAGNGTWTTPRQRWPDHSRAT